MNLTYTYESLNNLSFTLWTSSEDDAKVRMCSHTAKHFDSFFAKNVLLLT